MNNTPSHTVRALVSLVLLSLLALPAFAAEANLSADLDGTTYSVTVGTGDSSWDDDLVFSGGTFRSTACDEYGFFAESYSAATVSQGISFESHGTSAEHGTSHWQGTLTGDTVTGTLTWTQPGQDPVVYPFEGSVKK